MKLKIGEAWEIEVNGPKRILFLINVEQGDYRGNKLKQEVMRGNRAQ